MIPLRFQGEVWKQGNSLLITIPKNVRDIYNIKEKDILDVHVTVINKKVLEKMKELERLRNMFNYEGSGVIWHKKEKIGVLKKIFLSEFKFKAGGLAPGESFDKLPTLKSVHGVIFDGMFFPEIYSEKHFGKHGIDKVFGTCVPVKFEILLENGNRMELENMDFDPGFSTEKSLRIKKIEFNCHIK